MLRGIDRAAFATAFSLRLRDAGISVGFTSMESFARVLGEGAPYSLSRLYWAARISLVRRRSDLEVFDAVFAAVFDDALLSLDPNTRRQQLTSGATGEDARSFDPADTGADGAGLPWITLPSVVGTASGSDSEIGVPELLPSDLEGLADIPFEELDPADLALLGGWLESALDHWPTRRSRRLAASDPAGGSPCGPPSRGPGAPAGSRSNSCAAGPPESPAGW